MRARVRFVIFLRSDSCVMAFLFVFAHRCRRCRCVLAEAVSQMISPTTIGCVILTPPSGFEALCSHIGVFFDG